MRGFEPSVGWFEMGGWGVRKLMGIIYYVLCIRGNNLLVPTLTNSSAEDQPQCRPPDHSYYPYISAEDPLTIHS